MIFHEQKAGASPTLKDTTWPTTGPQPATSHSGHQDSPDCQANCQAAAKDKGINSFPGCSPSVRDHDTITGIIMVTMAVLLRKALQGGIDVLLKNAHEFYEIHRNTIPGPNTSDEIQKSWPGSNSPAKKKHFPIVSPFQPLLPLSSLRYHPQICIEQWTDKRATGINMRKKALDARFKCEKEDNACATTCNSIQVEVKVIPHCPFWAFPIVNAVSKKSSLSHPFGGFPHVNARFTECFFLSTTILKL